MVFRVYSLGFWLILLARKRGLKQGGGPGPVAWVSVALGSSQKRV